MKQSHVGSRSTRSLSSGEEEKDKIYTYSVFRGSNMKVERIQG